MLPNKFESFDCPYCGKTVVVIPETHITAEISFQRLQANKTGIDFHYSDEFEFRYEFFKCPSCNNVTTIAVGKGNKVKDRNVLITPMSNCKKFPEYIPLQIRNDYEEACAIVNLSPKASATLSRRCLQGMIHNYWEIHEKNLNAEITSLQSHVQPAQWKAIDALRSLGNIGAHMEKDVNTIVDIEPNEANKLIKLIELLMSDWYIQRNEQELLYAEITNIGEDKEKQRKGN